jgi:hypothetical protein
LPPPPGTAAKAFAIAWICVDVRLDNEFMRLTLEMADWSVEADAPRTLLFERAPWHELQ